MDKVSLFKFYQLRAHINALRNLTGTENLSETHRILALSMSWLNDFQKETKPIPWPNTRKALRAVIQYGKELQESVNLNIISNKAETIVTAEIVSKIRMLLEEFEREFDHDSREVNVLSVPDRGAYKTRILIDRGEDLLLSSNIKQAVSVYARNEFDDAGKCLAFGLPTAAAFHLVRALESILRRYYDALSGGAPRPKTKSGNDVAMGAYIDQVQGWAADPKVVATLRQIKDLHRNPITHPQDVLTDDEGLALVGVVVDAIRGMAEDARRKGHTSLA